MAALWWSGDVFRSFWLGVWMHASCMIGYIMPAACSVDPMIVYMIIDSSYFCQIHMFFPLYFQPRAEAPPTLLIDRRVCKLRPNKAFSHFMVFLHIDAILCTFTGKSVDSTIHWKLLEKWHSQRKTNIVFSENSYLRIRIWSVCCFQNSCLHVQWLRHWRNIQHYNFVVIC